MAEISLSCGITFLASFRFSINQSCEATGPAAPGTQIAGEFLEQGGVACLSLAGKGFEVNHQTAIFVGGEECGNLLPEAAPRRGIIQESTDVHPVDAVK